MQGAGTQAEPDNVPELRGWSGESGKTMSQSSSAEYWRQDKCTEKEFQRYTEGFTSSIQLSTDQYMHMKKLLGARERKDENEEHSTHTGIGIGPAATN